MYRDTRIHVVIPAYNVEPLIGAVLKGLPDFVDTVTVVDDGSRDGTQEAIGRVGDARVTVLRRPQNEGVGAAMVAGFRHALGLPDGIIVKMDGDGQMDPEDLPRLLDPIIEGRCEYAKGNRFLFDRQLTAMPRARLAGNFILTFLTKLASGYWHVFDPQNGYLAVHSSALRLLDLERLSKRYFFENDMLINLNVFDIRVKDVAMPARYGDEMSSMKLWRIITTFPFHLFRGYWSRFYRKHVLRDFSAVALFMLTGLPLLAFGTGFGAYSWLQSYLHNRVTPTGTVMLSVLPLLVGFELVLQGLVLEIKDSPRQRDDGPLR
jgi:dolichol-phosphate mannosyltransferase